MDKSNIAVSCRVRLARNFADTRFPHLLDAAQAKEVRDKVHAAFADSGKFNYIELAGIPEVDRYLLMERHLISPDLIKYAEKASVLIKKDESISVMVNEEDHIRLQSMRPELDLAKAEKTAAETEHMLGEKLGFAYDKQFGYITSCPTNLGTGMRASVMLHLPALKLTNTISGVLYALNKIGLTVRGIYGEGSEAQADMYQLSNRISLGLTNSELVNMVTDAADKLMDSEQEAREGLLANRTTFIEDKIFRSYGIMQNARSIASAEFMSLLSDVKLGVSYGILKEKKPNVLNKLIIDVQPAGIIKISGKEDNVPEERDRKRAEIVRKVIQENITE